MGPACLLLTRAAIAATPPSPACRCLLTACGAVDAARVERSAAEVLSAVGHLGMQCRERDDALKAAAEAAADGAEAARDALRAAQHRHAQAQLRLIRVRAARQQRPRAPRAAHRRRAGPQCLTLLQRLAAALPSASVASSVLRDAQFSPQGLLLVLDLPTPAALQAFCRRAAAALLSGQGLPLPVAAMPASTAGAGERGVWLPADALSADWLSPSALLCCVGHTLAALCRRAGNDAVMQRVLKFVEVFFAKYDCDCRLRCARRCAPRRRCALRRQCGLPSPPLPAGRFRGLFDALPQDGPAAALAAQIARAVFSPLQQQLGESAIRSLVRPCVPLLAPRPHRRPRDRRAARPPCATWWRGWSKNSTPR